MEPTGSGGVSTNANNRRARSEWEQSSSRRRRDSGVDLAQNTGQELEITESNTAESSAAGPFDGMCSIGYEACAMPTIGTVGHADWAFMCGYGGFLVHSEGNVQLFE